MLHAKTRITTVRMAVARLESISLTPALASTAVRPANRAESNAQWSQFIGDVSKNRAHDTALHTQCRAVGCGRKRTGYERNHGRHLVRCGKALQERTWSYRAEKLLFHFSARGVFRSRHVG